MADQKNRTFMLMVPVLAGLLVATVILFFVIFPSPASAPDQSEEMLWNLAEQAAPGAAPAASAEHSESGSVTPESAPEAVSCDFAGWVGQPVDEAALKATGRAYRILPPGAMYTMDYQAARINVHTDDEGIVAKVDCG